MCHDDGRHLVQPETSELDPARVRAIEAFADTIIPGEKRSPDDVAIAGVARGGGAVAAGALDVLLMPEGGMAAMVGDLADALNAHATAFAGEHGREVDGALPPFVALSYADRRALVGALTTPGHPEKEMWTGVALMCNMAFDTAAHLHTVDALAAGHPGLTAMRFADPDADGLWRFPAYSYGRALAELHPDTTPSGSPA